MTHIWAKHGTGHNKQIPVYQEDAHSTVLANSNLNTAQGVPAIGHISHPFIPHSLISTSNAIGAQRFVKL